MKGTNLTYGQIIAIGVAFLFGLPICVGLAVGHFFDIWFGVVSGVAVLLVIAYIGQRWMKRTGKQDK